MTARQAANQTMFRAAHADARATVARFGFMPYRMAFANALGGLQAARFGGVTIIEPSRVWA